MASNNSYPPLRFPVLNPHTSLAFLSPSEAAQIEATRFLYVSSLAAFIWDILSSLHQDYRLLTEHTFNLPTAAYFVSRIATLAFVTTGTVFYVASVGSCRALTIVTGWCWAFAAPSTSLLFFFRARAVFEGRRVILAIFGILWLATLGGSLSIPFSISGDHIVDTDRCQNTSIRPLTAAGIIGSICNDTIIFVAISWHVIRRTAVKGKIKSFFCGHDLPFISKELIQGGQQYYFITVIGNILTMALILTPSTSPLIRAMFPVPSKALENAMACRVFRDIKLGRTSPETHSSGTDHRPPTVSGAPAYALRTLRTNETRPSREPIVQIKKTVDRFDDRESDHVGNDKADPLPRTEDEYV